MQMILTENKTKTNQSTAQKIFYRLKKQIENLREALVVKQKLLDKSLNYYHANLQVAKDKSMERLTEVTKLLYTCYKNAKKLTKKERKELKELIVRKICLIFDDCYEDERDLQLCEIFKDLEGVDFKEVINAQFDKELEIAKKLFENAGIDVDLEDLDSVEDREEITEKILESLKKVREKAESDHFKEKEKPKTKLQLAKEAKAQELENLQKKGLSTVYKQLAKVIHPDLELDLIIKKEKEEIMKKLTVAYEKNDLHTLLSLEMEWNNRSENSETKSTFLTDEQLKVYNSILKDQISEIKERIRFEYLNPKYADIQEYANEIFSPIILMESELNDIEEESKLNLQILKMLQAKDAEMKIRYILGY